MVEADASKPARMLGKYEVHDTLGDGAFGKVKGARNTQTGDLVAIKFMDKEKIRQQGMNKQIQREITSMRRIRHPHVVDLIEVLTSATKIFLVMEQVTGGDLFERIVEAARLDEEHAKSMFAQLISAVGYCHRMGVCHRDLKPENILTTEGGALKISDFGLSAEIVDKGVEAGANDKEVVNLLSTTCGTCNYIAPEVLADAGYDGAKADVWSCGIILFVMLAGYLPFDDRATARLFKKILEEEVRYPEYFSDGAVEIIEGLLQKDVSQRWSLARVKAHPWLRKIFDDTDQARARRKQLQIPEPEDEEANAAAAAADAPTAATGTAPGPTAAAPAAAPPRPQLAPLPPPPPPSPEAASLLQQLQAGPPADMAGISSAFDVLGLLGGCQPTPDGSREPVGGPWSFRLDVSPTAALAALSRAAGALGHTAQPGASLNKPAVEGRGLALRIEAMARGKARLAALVRAEATRAPDGGATKSSALVVWVMQSGDVAEGRALFEACRDRAAADGAAPAAAPAQFDGVGSLPAS
jgi:serine/threonine protein kinase